MDGTLFRPTGAILLCIGLLTPAAAHAQGGAYGRLSLSMTQLYESNLFASPTEPVSDFITRIGPVLEVGHVSFPATVSLRAEADAERYMDHPDLNKTIASKSVDFNVRANPSERFAWTAGASYIDTQNPAEFSIENALVIGRARASRRAATSAVSYAITPLTHFIGDYDYARDILDGGYGSWLHSGRAGFDHRVGVRDHIRVIGGIRFFSFDAPAIVTRPAAPTTPATTTTTTPPPSTTTTPTPVTVESTTPIVDVDAPRVPVDSGPARRSYVGTVGWVHEFSPRASLEVDGGPRITEDLYRPEVSALLRRDFRRGGLALRYIQTEMTAIGERWPLDVQHLVFDASYRPNDSFTLRAAPSIARDARKPDELDLLTLGVLDPVTNQRVLVNTTNHVEVYAVDVSAAFEGRRVTFLVGGRFGRQSGILGGLAEPISLRTFTVQLVVTPPPSKPNEPHRPESPEDGRGKEKPGEYAPTTKEPPSSRK